MPPGTRLIRGWAAGLIFSLAKHHSSCTMKKPIVCRQVSNEEGRRRMKGCFPPPLPAQKFTYFQHTACYAMLAQGQEKKRCVLLVLWSLLACCVWKSFLPAGAWVKFFCLPSLSQDLIYSFLGSVRKNVKVVWTPCSLEWCFPTLKLHRKMDSALRAPSIQSQMLNK